MRRRVHGEGSPRVTLRCSPYHTNSALYPEIEFTKRIKGWTAADDGAERLEKLEQIFGDLTRPLEEVVPLLADLLSLPLTGNRYEPHGLTPQQLKQQTADALVAWTLEAAEQEAVLHVWEDIHWADPTTLELIGLLIDQSPTT